MFKHILVPTDGSELSQKAVDAAIELRHHHGGDGNGLCLSARISAGVFSDVVVEMPPDFQARCEREAREHLEWVEAAAAKAGIRCQTRLSTDASPSLGIVRAAEGAGCDMILMASHGHWGLAHLLGGSETRKVLSHTKIPVLIYR